MRAGHAVLGATLATAAVLGLGAAVGASQSSPTGGVPAAALNRAVSQSNLTRTICTAGYAGKVKPSAGYLHRMAQLYLETYQVRDKDMSHYVVGFRIPVEVGGSPTNPRNIWAESPGFAKQDRKLLAPLKNQICAGKLGLGFTQSAFWGLAHLRGAR